VVRVSDLRRMPDTADADAQRCVPARDTADVCVAGNTGPAVEAELRLRGAQDVEARR